LFWLACALIAFAVAAGLVEPLVAMFRLVPIPDDYNEGWNAFWADAAMRGTALYPSRDSTILNNYPPLSFFIVGALGRVVGDSLIAGRLLSVTSFVAIVTFIFLWLKSTGSTRGFAMFGAAVFAASLIAWSPDYVGADDPQLLAHAVMMTGLWLLWRADFRTSDVVLGAALMVCGGFIKHLLIPLPLVMTVWIAVNARRQLGTWLVGCIATGAFLFALTYALYGPDFFANLLFARTYSRERAMMKIQVLVNWFWPLMVLVGAIAVQLCIPASRKRLWPRGSFVVLYAVVSCVVGGYSSGGAGVDRNAFFDFLIAASLSAALSLEALGFLATRASPWPQLRAGAVYGISLALAALFIFRLTGLLANEERTIGTLQAREAEASEAIRLIKETGGGHAACETLSLCYWANTDFEVDFFGYFEKLATGVLPLSSCEAVFLAPQMRLIQIEKNKGQPVSRRLAPECTEVIRSHYTVLLDSDQYVLFARDGA
jgi:hypothetical protein